MRRRRILWAISSLAAGGAERMVCELANAFAARGHRVGVLTLSTAQADHYRLDDAVERIRLDIFCETATPWGSAAANWRRSRMIRDAVRNFGPDIVISFIETVNVRVVAALLGTGIPVVVSERVDPRRHAAGRAWDRARRLLYPFAAGLVVQTNAVSGWARHMVRKERIHVIPNFVRDMPPAPEDRESLSLLAVGRLDPQKGFDILLRAFAASGLAARGVRLTILGEGGERARLEDLAADIGIAAAVEMPGIVPDPETWMARATAFVLPSRYEGFPNALLEAMAMGCPAIAADCDSGAREIVRHGENGLLVPVGDAGALAGALAALFADEALRRRLGREAVKVRESFSAAAILAAWESVIARVGGRA